MRASEFINEGVDSVEDIEEDVITELKYDPKVSKKSMKAGMKDANKGRDWNHKKSKFKDNESDPHAYMVGQNKGEKKLKEDKGKINKVIDSYNDEHMDAGGSEANITGPNKVTVTSLDDFEDMFIGSFEAFTEWYSGMNETQEPTLSRGEKALGWRIKNGVKVKIGKGNPTVAPSLHDTMNNFIERPKSRNTNRDTDDGSHGLSNRDRNR